MLEETLRRRRRSSGSTARRAAILAAGPVSRRSPAAPPPGDAVDPVDLATAPQPATDDWPFLYLREPVHRAVLPRGAGLRPRARARPACSARARGGGHVAPPVQPALLRARAAFLLLETRSLVSFSLLFGSTWLVNALAFFAILASVLLAILVNARLRIRRAGALYVGALRRRSRVAFLLPPESLLIDPPALRYLLAGRVAFAPVFLANLVFTYSFRDTRTADMAFASNLLGAMVGGAMEYVALLTGYRLLLVVAGLYVVAYLLATRVRRLADVDLAQDCTSPGNGSRDPPDSQRLC